MKASAENPAMSKISDLDPNTPLTHQPWKGVVTGSRREAAHTDHWTYYSFITPYMRDLTDIILEITLKKRYTPNQYLLVLQPVLARAVATTPSWLIRFDRRFAADIQDCAPIRYPACAEYRRALRPRPFSGRLR